MRILAISGSLRSASSNTTILRAARRLAPEDVVFDLFDGLAALPYFNADLDDETPPAPVAAFRASILGADALVISSPEYAHGVPGVLKNALDWLVGGTQIIGKPVALWNGSPRATQAQASLTDTLSTIGARVLPAASITVDLLSRKVGEAGMISDPEIAGAICRSLATLVAECANGP